MARVASAPAAVDSVPGDGTPAVPPVGPAADAELLWYVRLPDGAEYGPATDAVLRQWIAEGRLPADAYVWRQDWADWKLAGEQYPMETPNAVQPAVPTGIVIDADRSSRSRPRPKSGLALVVGLTIASLLLLGALIYVVVYMN
jgi:hypothetical protein